MPFVLLGPLRQHPIPLVMPARRDQTAAHQLELRDQSVEAFQELITFLGELFVEFFELVYLALQARDVDFSVCRCIIFSVLAPSSYSVQYFSSDRRHHFAILWIWGLSLFVPKKSAPFLRLCFRFSVPFVVDRTYHIN